jgi:hypothetical protein
MGPSAGIYLFNSGVPATIPELIGYPSRNEITFPDGRVFPATTPNGSTFKLQYP